VGVQEQHGMKRILLILSLGIASKFAIADVGNCVCYHVEVQFKDSSSIIGHMFLLDYLLTIPQSDSELLETISKRFHTKWGVYTNLDEVVLSNHVGPWIDSSMLGFYVSTEDDIVRFQFEDVQRIRIIAIAYCGNDDASKGFYWNGIYPVVVDDLNADEVGWLMAEKPLSTGFQLRNDELSYFMLIAETSEEGLLALSQEVSHQLQQHLDSNEGFEQSFHSLKMTLRKKGAVLIRFGFPA